MFSHLKCSLARLVGLTLIFSLLLAIDIIVSVIFLVVLTMLSLKTSFVPLLLFKD